MILEAHKSKNFVQRILNPSAYPELPLGDGRVGTHLMSWGTDDTAGAYAYPQIMYDPKTKQLTNHGDAAWDIAKQRGEMIPFDRAEEADWFSKNYKKVWPKEKR